MKVDQIAIAIKNAIEKRCFLPALALSLVIPDICAQYDYPEIYNKKSEYNGHKGQGAPGLPADRCHFRKSVCLGHAGRNDR